VSLQDKRQAAPAATDATDADGIVIHRRDALGGGWRRTLPSLAVLLAIAVTVAWMLRAPGDPTADPAATHPAATKLVQNAPPVTAEITPNKPAATQLQAAIPPRVEAIAPVGSAPADEAVAGIDPDDLANYISPDEPEPTMREVITALNEAGIHSGLGAFNPPGTSPPLPGIAVPDDFALPEGFVRHHQVSDAGEPIEPILMFSPDFDFYDDAGRLIALPENRVVPPELAPPGLPIRQVVIPPPP